ncbi:hypothetical protein TcCL_NonESM01059 [Trypanosoma cruzi]|nr:hypothetical protein TcCL_NonESM01059 [Trypanosoma cruzi]
MRATANFLDCRTWEPRPVISKLPVRLSGVGETRSGVLRDKAKSPTGDRPPGNASCLIAAPGPIAPYCRGKPAMFPSWSRGYWRRADGINQRPDQLRLTGGTTQHHEVWKHALSYCGRSNLSKNTREKKNT